MPPMRHEIATVLLAPILVRQGRQVRRRVLILPEPSGARQGRLGQGPLLRVLIIGDSAGAGVGASTQDEALSGRLTTALAVSHTVKWRLVARSGATVDGIIRRLNRLPDEPRDWVVVSLGVNDVIARKSMAAWRDSLEQLRALLHRKFNQPRILFSGLPPLHLFPALPEPLRWYLGARARDFDKALAVWAAGQPDCERLATDFSRDPNLMASDGFHPGPGLYKLWGQAAADHILARAEAPVAAGWCARCGTEHRLEQGPALAPARQLQRDLERYKRIDFDAATPDPRLATDYLYGPACGQMFGVLVGEDPQGRKVVLRAFSCQYNGIWEVEGWAPPLFPVEAYEEIMVPGDRQVKALGRQLASLPAASEEALVLKQQRRELSRDLMKELHALYEVRNFNGESRSLAEFFTHARGIPTGAGDCCAPKLLNQAAQLRLRPLGLAEFYWGRTNRSGTRKHAEFYGSCADRCQPMLGFMLCGAQP